MRRPTLLLLVAAFAAAVTCVGLGSAGTVAAVPRWGPSHGPEGGPALALAVAPSAPETVYVGTKGGGVFRSTNGGRRWRSGGLALRFPATLQGITSLAVDPRSPNTVYAGVNSRWDGGATYYRPAYKTTDGGRTWRTLGLKTEPLAISPTRPATVYAVGSK